jgi:NADP-dependent 3-hydroxy acid dehydrogenase YdfG
MKIFENKTVLITAASGNLGVPLAQEFAQQGANIVLCARDVNKLSTVEAALKEVKASYLSASLDVRSYSSCENAVVKAIEHFGKIDLLINIASDLLVGWQLDELSADDIENEINTTLRGAIFMSKAVFPHLVKNKCGHIVNVSSISGLDYEPCDSPVYAAGKAGLIKFSESLHSRASAQGISCSCVVPCAIRNENLITENAVSYADICKVILMQCDRQNNLCAQTVILRPAQTN